MSGSDWWSDLPQVRQFMTVYGKAARSTDASLELGTYGDTTLRLNCLGASWAQTELHATVLPPWLFDIVEMAARDAVPFHVGLRIAPPAEVRAEVYLVTIAKPLPAWLARMAGACTPDLAMLGVSCEQVKRYVVERPTIGSFGLKPVDCQGRRVTQLCQTTLSGARLKRYLDVRPFPADLQPLVQKEAGGAIARSDLPYGVIARSKATWGFYAPL